MLKIYICEFPLILVTPVEYQSMSTSGLTRVEDNSKALSELIDWMLMAPSKSYLCICTHPEKTLDRIKTILKPIDSAGGIVYNNQGEILMIKRLGYWDLPKGKVDPGETFDFTAIREVKEECGITDCTIINQVESTYHVYVQHHQRMIKTCYWYLMKSEGNTVPRPQIEEHIEAALWVNPATLDLDTLQTYNTIRELLINVLGKSG